MHSIKASIAGRERPEHADRRERVLDGLFMVSMLQLENFFIS